VKLRLTIIAICAVLAASLVGREARAVDIVSDNGYSLTIPDKWKAVQSPGADNPDGLVDYFLAAPVEDKFSAFATVKIQFPPPGTTPDNLRDAIDKTYQAAPGNKLLAQREVKIDGCPALDWTIQYTGMTPPRLLRTRTIAVLRNDLCYVFRFTSLDSRNKEYDRTFGDVVKSIHWTNKTRT
jgi:hypothetical protein